MKMGQHFIHCKKKYTTQQKADHTQVTRLAQPNLQTTQSRVPTKTSKLAAIMTPEAKPKHTIQQFLADFFGKKHQLSPTAVIPQVKSVPIKA
jgi:hypothetical protein